MKPLVSLVLGILNADRTLEECLKSIFQQDFSKSRYEVIIVDGGSDDRTLEISKKFMRKHKNIKLLHNLHKLSEGRGMSKDIGVQASEGKIVIFLDHDNIILGKNWLTEILEPFDNPQIMASQSLLKSQRSDSNFLKYVNEIGVEDPFAVQYSLVSQIVLNPKKFKTIKERYYKFDLNKSNILFFGANGCAFRKSVFPKIGGYTRDVDVSASMAHKNMSIAVPLSPRLYHKTSNNLFSFLKKKGVYFYRFINKEYKVKTFKWTEVGSPPSKVRFLLMVLLNLTIIVEFMKILPQFIKSRNFFWLLHPFYVFYVTLEYGLLTLFKIKNFLEYL